MSVGKLGPIGDPSGVYNLPPIFEAVLRAVGGGVEMSESRPINLSGKLVVDRPRPGIVRVRTQDLAEGRWNPAQAMPIIEDGEEVRYANLLAEHGIEIIEESIVALVRNSKFPDIIRKCVDEEMNRILNKALEIAASKKYLEDIEKEEAEENAKRQSISTPKPFTSNAGQRRRLPRG